MIRLDCYKLGKNDCMVVIADSKADAYNKLCSVDGYGYDFIVVDYDGVRLGGFHGAIIANTMAAIRDYELSVADIRKVV